MLFSEAIAGVELAEHAGPDVTVEHVTHDSRQAGPGAVFVAMRGESSDGNRFVENAVALGAVAVITDSLQTYKSLAVTNHALGLGLCGTGRHALAGIAANLYRHPERELKLAGVTGTNGKTTTTFLLESMLQAAGRKTLLLGTIENHLCGNAVAAQHTTPEPDALYGLLREAVQQGASEAVMEVSSHGLEQGRVWGVGYDVAVFTNLTRDHLDFHGSMEAYLAAKKRLFVAGGTGAGAPRVAVVNVDDAAGRNLAEELRRSVTEVVTYGWSAGDFHASDVELAASGTRFTLRTPDGTVEIRTSLAGRVNVWNILAAAGAARARSISLEEIAAGVNRLAAVPGRFQQVVCGQNFAVVVDYAHTDDALRNLTRMAREVAGAARVITLFGCGGDRDRAKRPLMARAASESSNVVILTSDNPRSEDPAAILRDAEAGLAGSLVPYRVIEDRAAAIAAAIAEARAGDVVLLAGKGHEKTQTTRDGVMPFDDVAVARAALERICN